MDSREKARVQRNKDKKRILAFVEKVAGPTTCSVITDKLKFNYNGRAQQLVKELSEEGELVLTGKDRGRKIWSLDAAPEGASQKDKVTAEMGSAPKKKTVGKNGKRKSGLAEPLFIECGDVIFEIEQEIASGLSFQFKTNGGKTVLEVRSA